MNLPGIWPVAGPLAGFFGGVATQWLASRVTRKQKRTELQEQTIKDLQEALAGIGILGALAGISRNIANAEPEGDDVPVNVKLQRANTQLERLKDRYEKFLAYTSGKRRVEILISRIHDLKARKLAAEVVALAETRFLLPTNEKVYEVHVMLAEKFTKANDHLGELLRELH